MQKIATDMELNVDVVAAEHPVSHILWCNIILKIWVGFSSGRPFFPSLFHSSSLPVLLLITSSFPLQPWMPFQNAPKPSLLQLGALPGLSKPHPTHTHTLFQTQLCHLTAASVPSQTSWISWHHKFKASHLFPFLKEWKRAQATIEIHSGEAAPKVMNEFLLGTSKSAALLFELNL